MVMKSKRVLTRLMSMAHQSCEWMWLSPHGDSQLMQRAEGQGTSAVLRKQTMTDVECVPASSTDIHCNSV